MLHQMLGQIPVGKGMTTDKQLRMLQRMLGYQATATPLPVGKPPMVAVDVSAANEPHSHPFPNPLSTTSNVPPISTNTCNNLKGKNNNSISWKAIWQRFPGVTLLFLLPFAIWGPIYMPWTFTFYYILLHALFLFNNARSAYSMFTADTQARLTSITDWKARYYIESGSMNGTDARHELPFDSVSHIIILPNYKEDLNTLEETLDVLASHPYAIRMYTICLAMEESEGESAISKANYLCSKYEHQFFHMTYTCHPRGRSNEIRGKSSNVAWASREMASINASGSHHHEIVTVMDADSCFSADYFAAVTYHYVMASEVERSLMMFAPCTVFNRNAHDVPILVRVTDIFWCVGVISNLYPSSDIKIPCSAYSVSMELAVKVDFWDAGPEAIGEDLHMYLKCFFATQGRVKVQSIFSPASQCNVEHSVKGWKGLLGGLSARYTQAKRHLWGSLDTGYTIRKSFAISGIPLSLKLELVRRLLEAHILMGHMFTLILFSWLMLPSWSSASYSLASYLHGLISVDAVHPAVIFALSLSFWIRISCIVPNVVMIYFYDRYHQWVTYDRWTMPLGIYGKNQRAVAPVFESDEQVSRCHLGKAPCLRSKRIFENYVDWLLVPVAGFFFYVLPQFHAQLSQIFTDSLEYKVAAKPTMSRKPTCDDLSNASSLVQVSVQPVEDYASMNRFDMVKSAKHMLHSSSSTLFSVGDSIEEDDDAASVSSGASGSTLLASPSSSDLYHASVAVM